MALLAILLPGCAPLTQEISDDVATEIGTAIQVQVGTAAVAQVGTAVATHFPTPRPQPSTQAEPPRTAYSCERTYCKDMTVCAEAVYKLKLCGHSRLDSDGDGIPCEAICRRENIDAILASFASSDPAKGEARPTPGEETATVIRVIDGDTIDVLLKGESARIRYVQINTPERDQPCFHESTRANADLVANQFVRLLPSKTLADRYGRLLRYVYVGDIMVERALVAGGFAEVVLYPPNDAHYQEFLQLEKEAAAAGRGCHPTGIFDDGSYTR